MLACLLGARLSVIAIIDNCDTSGVCAEEMVEAAEDAALELLRVEFLQIDVVRQLADSHLHGRRQDGLATQVDRNEDQQHTGLTPRTRILAPSNRVPLKLVQQNPSLDAAVGTLGQAVAQRAADFAAASINSSLSQVDNAVAGLQSECIKMHGVVVQRVNHTYGSAQEQWVEFEAAVHDGVAQALIKWGDVVVALESLQAAAPTALQTLRLVNLAEWTSGELGKVLGLAKEFEASLRNIPSSVAGLGQATREVAVRQLTTITDAGQACLIQADEFSNTFLHTFSNLAEKTTTLLGVRTGTFSSTEQAAHRIVQRILDSAHVLEETITEAVALVDVAAHQASETNSQSEPVNDNQTKAQSAAAEVSRVRCLFWIALAATVTACDA